MLSDLGSESEENRKQEIKGQGFVGQQVRQLQVIPLLLILIHIFRRTRDFLVVEEEVEPSPIDAEEEDDDDDDDVE